MKKYLALSIFSVLVYTICMGQKNSMEFGIQGGVNFNSAYGNAVGNEYKSTLTGFNTGVHIKYKLSEQVAVKALLQFEQNGWAYRSLTFETNQGNNVLGKGDALHRLYYLNLPVLAAYSFGNTTKFNIAAGLFTGAMLTNQVVVRIKEPYAPNNTPTTKSKSDAFKSFNFGLCFGAGVQVPLSAKMNFITDLRYNHGLANISKGQSSIKTTAFSIQAGLSFPM